MNDAALMKSVEEIADWVIELRRSLDKIPERGFEEIKTQALIMRTLDELGIPYTTHRTWVVGMIEGAQPGKTVALRADIDGLPVQENTACEFRSEHEGYMHACGHDAHTAILLGAARVLSQRRAQLSGCVKLLFQPAEESIGGAEPMVAAGVLNDPKVDLVYGLHVMSRMPMGMVETRAGTLNASSDDIQIEIHGRGSHGAYPEGGADAIVCAAQVISALQTIVSRNVSPVESAVVSIGMIEGGTASNVMCDNVRMRGTLRTANPKLREKLIGRIHAVVENVATAMGCEGIVRFKAGYSALVNWPEEAERVLQVAERLFGADKVAVKPEPSMGAEDFSYYLENTPGAFYHIGCADPDGPIPAAPLHSRDFTLDERCLSIGVMMQTALALHALGQSEES